MKALIWLGEYFSPRRLDQRVAVVAANDGVGHHALVLGDQRIVVAAADQALDGVQRVGRVGDRLALGRLADQTLPAVGEGDHAGGGARAFRVLDDADVLAFQDGDAGIGGTEIDTDHFTHMNMLLSADGGGPKHRRCPFGECIGCMRRSRPGQGL